MESEEADGEVEKQTDEAKRGLFSYNLFLDQCLNITLTAMLPGYRRNVSLETTYAVHFAVPCWVL